MMNRRSFLKAAGIGTGSTILAFLFKGLRNLIPSLGETGTISFWLTPDGRFGGIEIDNIFYELKPTMWHSLCVISDGIQHKLYLDGESK